MDLLEAAGGLMLLREVLEPDTPEYENATRDLAKFLVLARVSTAYAISLVGHPEGTVVACHAPE
jgi:hypothetical protein